MKRPLVAVVLLYGCGLLLAEWWQPPLPFLFAASLALAIGAIALGRLRCFLIWPLIILTGWTNLVYRTAILSPQDLRTQLTSAPEDLVVRGKLCETPGKRLYIHDEKESWRTLARLEVTALRHGTNWQDARGQIVVVTQGNLPTGFFTGEEVEIAGIIAPPPAPLAEGLFDYRSSLRRQGIYFQLKALSIDDWRLLSAKQTPPLSDRFLAWAKTSLARGLPVEDESLHLEWALTLGWKPALTDDVAEPFVRASTYHIFAVDGLRMAIIFGIFFALFRTLNVPRAWCGLLLIPLIWFYTALTGWPASAIRATVMLTIIILGWVLKRPSDLINSLFAAALVILIWQPQQLFQAGFQLSFFVVLCIIVTLPPLDEFVQRLFTPDPLLPDELRPRWQKILRLPARLAFDILLVSFAAWIGSIPLVAYYFHIVTPVSAPANLLAVPLCALVLVSNLAGLLLAGWFPAAAELFNHSGWFLMECIRVTSRWFANLPGAFAYVPAPSLGTFAVYYGLLIGTFSGWLFSPKRRKWSMVVVVLIGIFYFARWQSSRAETQLTVLPLNGGHGIFVDASGRKNDWLIDCGNDNAVEFVVKPFLRAQGVNHLSRLALTHGDLRDIGGAQSLCDLFSVGQVITSSVRFRSATYRHIIETLEQMPERHKIINRGDSIGGWRVLYPEPTNHFPQADDNALVLKGEFHGTRVLLLSDLGRPGQNALLERTNDLHADIVVTGLPEQTEPLCDALLEAVQPKVIIVMDSEFPATKRATPALHERLEKRNIPVIYTRTAGAVEISLRPNRWSVKPINGEELSGTPGVEK